MTMAVKHDGESDQDQKTKVEILKGKIYESFEDLFKNNKESKNFEYEVEFEKDMETFQQKGRRIPIHFKMR